MSTEDPDEQFYRDTESTAFPKLTDRQIALLEPLGQRRMVRKGEVVIEAGQRDFPLVIILSGELEAYETRETEEQILGEVGPRHFSGGLETLTGTSSLAAVRGKAEESEILEIPASNLRRALAGLPGVGEPIIQAFMMRRERLKRDREFAGMRILGHPGCQGARRIDDFLDKNHVAHRLVDSTTTECQDLCGRLNLSPDDLPALIAADGSISRHPTIFEVARVAGLLRPLSPGHDPEVLCDLAIVGAGPAGLAAAVNAASEGLSTVVLESFAPGGQAGTSSLIENFFGFPTGISGGNLTYRAQLQAHRFGAKFTTPSRVLSLAFEERGPHRAAIRIEGCETVLRARCVIISSGAQYNKIGVPNLAQYEGVGVFYAATAMEAKFCKDSTVFVAGGGNSAGQAAMFLSEAARKVYLVIRGGDLSKSMSSYLSTRVESAENIEILRFTEIRKMSGAEHLESVEIENTQTGERRTLEATAVFSMIGAQPCTDWLPPEIWSCSKGFIKTGAAAATAPAWKDQERPPFPFETSIPGIFAAGDVRMGSVKRCSAAVGEGSMAIENVHQFLGTYA
jgi:thioredoxin reductase (NADPH)